MKRIFIFFFCVSFNWSYSQVGLEWANSIVDVDYNTKIGVDNLGNVYVSGFFDGIQDFDSGSGVFNLSSDNGTFFIRKQDTQGNFIWAKQLNFLKYSSSYSDYTDMFIDEFGNSYITGHFSGAIEIDTGVTIAADGARDAMVCKFDSAGSFVWVKQFQGSDNILINRVFVNKDEEVYIAGHFDGTVDFDVGTGVHNLNAEGLYDDYYACKLDKQGDFVWAKQLFTSTYPQLYLISISVDNSNNLYISGHFEGDLDFYSSSGMYNLYSSGASDIFISKLDTSGNFLWAKKMGGGAFDYLESIVTDNEGNVYSTGWFEHTADFDPGTGVYNLTAMGDMSALFDVFISKLDNDGNFLWAKQFEGSGYDVGHSIIKDNFNNIYVSGYFSGTMDVDPSSGVYNIVSGNKDVFICKLTGDGNFVWGSQFKASGSAVLSHPVIACDSDGNIYSSGNFYYGTIDFDPSSTTYNITALDFDAYVAKLNQQTLNLIDSKVSTIFLLYPNPNTGNFTVVFGQQLNNATITIQDVLGKTVYTTTVTEDKHNVQLNEAKGIYFVNIQTQQGERTTLKLVVE